MPDVEYNKHEGTVTLPLDLFIDLVSAAGDPATVTLADLLGQVRREVKE